MQVKNLEVRIKVGNKQHKLTNLILNKYYFKIGLIL